MGRDFDTIAKLALPDNMSSRAMNGRWLVIYVHAKAMSCTIDASSRCIRGGYDATSGSPISATTYTGRGWQQRLHADAVAWLQTFESDTEPTP